jgi:hypothetical protein
MGRLSHQCGLLRIVRGTDGTDDGVYKRSPVPVHGTELRKTVNSNTELRQQGFATEKREAHQAAGQESQSARFRSVYQA